MIKLPIIIHGVSGRMGQVALTAAQRVTENKLAQFNGEQIELVPIGVGRNLDKMKVIGAGTSMKFVYKDLNEAIGKAAEINSDYQLYHNTIATGIRKEIMLESLAKLDPATTRVFMEKPIAGNYADGLAIVNELEKRKFKHGVVHHMLEAPGVKKALELMPEIKPLHAQMKFGYEVASGLGEKKDYCCQRPDFNWTFSSAGGGIILDMCHEGYLSEALFGDTERLSATARLLVPKRLSYDRGGVIDCDVEDYADIRREHTNGVVNTSIWAWYRRINSEFGPLEITVDGENGSMVFGLYGLKVQWKETAPLLLWEKLLANLKIEWRDYWQYLDLTHQDPFAAEMADYVMSIFTGEKYWKDAIHALNVLGEVEALYESAGNNSVTIGKDRFFKYPKSVPANWRPERLQGKL